MSEKVRLEFKKLRETAILPFYAHPGDAGMDICAACEVVLKPGEAFPVPTGWALNIPLGYEVQIRPRSGLSYRTRLRLPNAPGTIDSGYKDELCILMYNASAENEASLQLTLDVTEKENRSGVYVIRPGDRVAQMILAPVSEAENVLVTAFSEGTQDRGGGFGSSGHRSEVGDAGVTK